MYVSWELEAVSVCLHLIASLLIEDYNFTDKKSRAYWKILLLQPF
jgi:hypothetical protein